MQLARSESASAAVGLLLEALDPAVGAGDHDPELAHVGDPLDGQRRDAVVGLVGGTEGGQVDVGERVGSHHQEGLVAEELGDVADAAGRAQQLVLVAVGELGSERRAVTEAVADGVREPVQVGDHLAEAVATQEQQDVLHHRAVGDRDHRLRDLVGEWAQAGPQARCHHHRFHRATRCPDPSSPGTSAGPPTAGRSRPHVRPASGERSRDRCPRAPGRPASPARRDA